MVGRVLATAFLQEGHSVMLGTRDVNKEEVTKWKSQNSNAQTGTFAQAAAFGEVLVLAVAGTVAEKVIEDIEEAHLSGKLVLDATNPIAPEPPVNGVLKYFTGPNESLMERLQQKAVDAHFVKAFNSVGNAQMYRPQLAGGPPTMFICGNHVEAKQKATHILQSFGWEVADMGGVEGARAIEPLAMLWCIPGFLQNSWMHAFKLLK